MPLAKYQIAVDHYADREPRPHCNRRLDIKITPRDLLADLVDAVLQSVPSGDDDPAVASLIVRSRQLRADAEQRRECGAGRKATPVMIDLVGNAGITRLICSRHPLKRERRSVGQDQPCPDQQRPFLTITDIAVVERSEEHTSELQSLMRISYAVFCLK